MNGHWSEVVFNTELMSRFLGGTSPIRSAWSRWPRIRTWAITEVGLSVADELQERDSAQAIAARH